MITFQKVRLEKIQLDIQKFKGSISGLRILHLSDLHIARFGNREARLISLVNREDPDIIFITGDLVNSYQDDFSACIQTLKSIRARHGIYAVFGNAEHTFRPIHLVNDFQSALMDINVTLLINSNSELRLNGNSLYLVGVDDPFFLFDKFDEAIQGVPQGAPTVLLAHSPDILFPRSDALVINLLDSELKRDRSRGWGWEDSTIFGPDNGDVYFKDNGAHTIRVQSRQDGVSLDTILLNPYEDIDQMLEAKDFEQIKGLLTSGKILDKYPDLAVISADNIDKQNMFGKWKKERDRSSLCNYRMDDLPPKKWRMQPLVNPKDYFEAEFHAKKNVKYHVWIRLKAHKGSPFNDSVYLQFSDSVDKHGKERYMINKPAYSKERMKDVDLILTGHTHGGQIRLPIYGPLATMTAVGRKYVSGLYELGKSMLYVSRGYGTSVIPFRLFCPSEITVFTFL
jgi:predicted MPP superfamily phosphohydrolase